MTAKIFRAGQVITALLAVFELIWTVYLATHCQWALAFGTFGLFIALSIFAFGHDAFIVNERLERERNEMWVKRLREMRHD